MPNMLEAAGQFDALFGLTHGLKSYDTWMHDNECWEPGCELEKAIKALAKAWKDTLKKGDAELGIDPEFTRPGIESLLEQLYDGTVEALVETAQMLNTLGQAREEEKAALRAEVAAMKKVHSGATI